MERKSLSSKLTFNRIVIVILTIAFFIFILNRSFNMAILIFGAAILIFGFSIFYLPDTIEFDDKNMYIMKRGDETIVDLKDIYMVKLTGMRFNYRHMWKIKYKINGIEKAARFYPDYSSALDEFTGLVKQKNPVAEIKYQSWFFDFDM